jgi:hypothetical protein
MALFMKINSNKKIIILWIILILHNQEWILLKFQIWKLSNKRNQYIIKKIDDI